MAVTRTPIALITGAAHGLGYEVVGRLAEIGHHVLITSRDAQRAARAAHELGERVSAVPEGLDIADPASVLSVANFITAEHGRLDVLINNAAGYADWSETVTSADLDVSRRVMDTNLYGTWRLTQVLLPLLRASSAPRIVNVSSGAGSHGDPAFGLAADGGAAASYGISKVALNALTAMLAAELRDTPIMVNAVCPGLTATYPGAEAMGARPVDQSAPGVVWAATLPDDGPRGGLFRDTRPLPW